MNGYDSSGLTIVGGRPNEERNEPSAISPGLQILLQRLAENSSLARDLVANLEKMLVRTDHGEAINVNQNLYRTRHNPCCFGSD